MTDFDPLEAATVEELLAALFKRFDEAMFIGQEWVEQVETYEVNHQFKGSVFAAMGLAHEFIGLKSNVARKDGPVPGSRLS